MTVTKIVDYASGRSYVLYGNFVFGVGELYTAGGQAASFGGIAKAARTPIVVWINALSGYDFVYIPGVDAQSGKVKIFQGGAALSNPKSELPAGAVPAAISSDTITFEAHFKGEM